MITFNIYKVQEGENRILLYTTENREEIENKINEFKQELINTNDSSVIFCEEINYLER